MGPGDRFQVAVMPGIGFGIQYAKWPYTHQIMVQLPILNALLWFIYFKTTP